MPAPKFTIPTTAKFVIKGLLHDCVITTHMPNGYINNALDIERLKCNAVVTDHEEMKVRLYDDLQRFRVVYAHAEAAFICDTLRSDTHQQDINPEVSMDSEITEEFGEFFSITEPGYSERLWNYDSIDQFFKYVEENKSEILKKIIVDYSGNGTIFIDLAGPEFRVQKYPNFIDRVGFML